jgi:hypothetical protein
MSYGDLGYPFFEPHFLGDKFPTIDFLVELVGDPNGRPFFLAQVKSTRRGYTNERKLRISTSKRDLRRLASFPLPTYLIGIDERNQMGYILAADSAFRRGISSMETTYPLQVENLQRLWDEVHTYWSQPSLKFAGSYFDSK